MKEDNAKKRLLLELEKLRQRIAHLEAEAEKRLQIEEALRQSEEYSATILNHSPNPIFVANPDSSIRYVNPAFESLTGFSLVELIGQKTPYPWWPEETSDEILERYKQASRHGVKAKEELFRKKNGENFWVEVTGIPVIINDEFRYYLINWTDITQRKKAEEALRESEKQYRALVELSLQGVVVVQDFRIVFANAAFAEISGYTVKELLSLQPQEVKAMIHPEDQTLVWGRFRDRLMGKPVPPQYEYRGIRKNGAVLWLEMFASCIEYGGKPAIQGAIIDISERKKLEDALHLRANLLNEATDSIIAHDLDGNLIYMNEATCRTRGYSTEEMLTMNVKALVSPRMADAVNGRLQRIQKEGAVTLESEHMRKDGSVFPVEVYARTVNLGDRTIILSVIRDITEHKKAEAALRESEERYRALLDLGERIGEAVVMLQDDERGIGRHVYVSEEWSRITGYSKEELMDISMADLIHPKDRQEAIRRHERRMRGEVLPGLYELTILRKDGSEVPVEVTYAYSSYKAQKVNVGYIRDISERKKMEEQLIVTGRLASIGELASGVAHELNNPLTSIIGFSELLLNKDIPDDVREDLKVIHREAQRTAQVVRNLLTFARKHETTKKPMDINQAIKSALDLRAYEQKVHNIEVVTNFDASLPEITADIFRLQQVFVNIIINAEYFMVQAHGKGRLTVTTERKGDVIRASFADDGPGIREEHLRHVFDPFFTTKEVGKGTGLGLSICHGIVTEHGGNIYVKSQLNRGATFIVDLPIK